MKKQQRGGTIVGFILGVIVGLGAALAVAVYVTKVPVPFLNKSTPRASEQDEATKNKNWDPNAPLYGKNPVRPAAPAAAPASDTATAAAQPASGPR
ncbi:MAG: sporulation protein, partial [Diaphorobacter nitroreducens]